MTRILLSLLFIFSSIVPTASHASPSDYICSLKQLDSQQILTTASAAISRGSCAAVDMNGDMISFCVTNNLGYRLGVSVFNATSKIYLMSAEQKLNGAISSGDKNPQRFEFIKRDFNLQITCDRSDEFALLTEKKISQ